MPGKLHRGKTLWPNPTRNRGTCPVCESTRIKLLYEITKDGEKLTVCKKCRNKKDA